MDNISRVENPLTLFKQDNVGGKQRHAHEHGKNVPIGKTRYRVDRRIYNPRNTCGARRFACNGIQAGPT
jgi:hypothetical protein